MGKAAGAAAVIVRYLPGLTEDKPYDEAGELRSQDKSEWKNQMKGGQK
jgi:hypothetical protein